MKDVDQQRPAMIDEEIYFHQLKNQLPGERRGSDGGVGWSHEQCLDPDSLGAGKTYEFTRSGVERRTCARCIL